MTQHTVIAENATAAGLQILGFAPVRPDDDLHPRVQSLILLGPDEPEFWPRFQASDEAQDGGPDALDRWSRRVIGTIACGVGGKAYFPFGGPPWRPFLDWAVRSGRCWSSPVGLLVHDQMGLFVSFRGAIGIEENLTRDAGRKPCDTCADKPCLDACPAGAMVAAGYDVPACKAWLSTGPGQVCMTGGCLVRRTCPVGAGRRPADQAAYHMEAFRGP